MEKLSNFFSCVALTIDGKKLFLRTDHEEISSTARKDIPWLMMRDNLARN